MAYITYGWCPTCQEDNHHLNHQCEKCADRLFREKKAIWKSKTSEEKIEELLKRIQALEHKHENRKYA